MKALAEIPTIPIKEDKNGVLRVGGTRVTLDSVVTAFLQGCTAEEIVFQFPVLDLADVYWVIGFYLKNKHTVQKYLDQNNKAAEGAKQQAEALFPKNGIRERLLNRKSNTGK